MVVAVAVSDGVVAVAVTHCVLQCSFSETFNISKRQKPL
jgi:hypothetical protein